MNPLNSKTTASSNAVITTENTQSTNTEKTEWQLDMEKKAKQLDEETRRINKKIDELNKEKISFITVSGIFLSIFTFISIEIQVLKHICSIEKILGFTFIIGGLLIGFIFLLDLIAQNWINNNFKGSSFKDIYSHGFKGLYHKKILSIKLVKYLFLIVIFIGLIHLGIKFINNNDTWICPETNIINEKNNSSELKEININIASPGALIQ